MRRMFATGPAIGCQINGVAMGPADNMNNAKNFDSEKALFGRFFMVRLGKKKYHLFELV